MRTFDYSPFYRATVGFDRVFDLLDSVAGYTESELNLTQKENELLVTGQAAPNAEGEKQFLYRGIAGRNFERRFQLADHVKVTGAKLANGLLTIELQREIPEEKKARAISITAETAKPVLTN